MCPERRCSGGHHGHAAVAVRLDGRRAPRSRPVIGDGGDSRYSKTSKVTVLSARGRVSESGTFQSLSSCPCRTGRCCCRHCWSTRCSGRTEWRREGFFWPLRREEERLALWLRPKRPVLEQRRALCLDWEIWRAPSAKLEARAKCPTLSSKSEIGKQQMVYRSSQDAVHPRQSR